MKLEAAVWQVRCIGLLGERGGSGERHEHDMQNMPLLGVAGR